VLCLCLRLACPFVIFSDHGKSCLASRSRFRKSLKKIHQFCLAVLLVFLLAVYPPSIRCAGSRDSECSSKQEKDRENDQARDVKNAKPKKSFIVPRIQSYRNGEKEKGNKKKENRNREKPRRIPAFIVFFHHHRRSESSHSTPGPSVVAVVVPVVVAVVNPLSLLALLLPFAEFVLGQIGGQAANRGSDRHVALAGLFVAAELAACEAADQCAGYSDPEALQGCVEVLVEFAADAGARTAARARART
jgi:hypothetical protein